MTPDSMPCCLGLRLDCSQQVTIRAITAVLGIVIGIAIGHHLSIDGNFLTCLVAQPRSRLNIEFCDCAPIAILLDGYNNDRALALVDERSQVVTSSNPKRLVSLWGVDTTEPDSGFNAVEVHSQHVAVIDGARNELRDLRLPLVAGLSCLRRRVLSLRKGLPRLHHAQSLRSPAMATRLLNAASLILSQICLIQLFPICLKLWAKQYGYFRCGKISDHTENNRKQAGEGTRCPPLHFLVALCYVPELPAEARAMELPSVLAAASNWSSTPRYTFQRKLSSSTPT